MSLGFGLFMLLVLILWSIAAKVYQPAGPPEVRSSDIIPMLHPVDPAALQRQLNSMKLAAYHERRGRGRKRGRDPVADVREELRGLVPAVPPTLHAHHTITVEPAQQTINVAPPNANIAVGPLYFTAHGPGAATVEPPPGDGGPLPEGVHFEPGEPTTFAEFDSQRAVVETMREAVAQARYKGLLKLRHPHIFLGPPGLGKSLLAKVLQNELNRLGQEFRRAPAPFFEELGTAIRTIEDLDTIIRRCDAHPGCTLFLDEIHSLEQKVAEKLNPLLTEHRYKFQGESALRKLHPFTIVAATTNVGDLHPALQRRFVSHDFEWVTADEQRQVLRRRGEGARFPIDEDAAAVVVERTYWSGAPWEALRLYDLAVTSAEARAHARVTRSDVERIIQRYDIDQYGLTRLDRAVIKAVFTQAKGRTVKGVFQVTHYAMSEETLIGVVGIDRHRYRQSVRPKLFARGLMTSRQGQALTRKAEVWYPHLREVA